MSRAPALLTAALLTAAGPLRADPELTVTARLEPQILAADELALLTIEVRGAGFRRFHARASFELDNLEVVAGPYQSESFRFADGVTSRSQSLSWRLRPQGPGPARVHSIRLTVREQIFELPQRQIQVEPESASPGPRPAPGTDPHPGLFDPFAPGGRLRSRTPAAPDVFLRAEAEPSAPYVGEQVVYTLALYTQGDVSAINPQSLPDFRGFWVKEIPQPQRPAAEIVELDGRRYARMVLLQRALFPLRAGRFEIAAARVHLVLRLPQRGPFGAFLPRTKDLQERSDPSVIHVRPLPLPPEGFAGAVGDLSLQAELAPRSVAVGEAASFNVTLEGTGHLGGLPAPELPEFAGLQVFPPQQSASEDLVGTAVRGRRSWTFVLVPRRVGAWNLPPLEVIFFDPEAEAYRVASASGTELTADPARAGTSVSGEPPLHSIRSAAVPPGGAHPWRATLPWLFGLPWVAALALFLARRRSAPADDAASRRRLDQALRRAREHHGERRAAARMEEAWRGFLQERWQVPAGTPITRWGSELAARGADPAAARELTALADDLHYLRYAPELSATAALLDELVQRSRRLSRSLK